MKLNKNPSILFLAGTLGQGGAEKQLFLMCKTLLLNKHKIFVVTFGINEYWEDPISQLGIKIIYIKYQNPLRRLFKLFSITKSIKPDFLYSLHFYTSIYVGIISKFFLKTHSIGSIRNNGYSEIKANIGWARFHMKLPDFIISNNSHGSFAIKDYLGLNQKKIFILNNSIEIQNSIIKVKDDTSILKLVFVGRLTQEKDPLLFIDICFKLKSYKIKFKADMFGIGPLSSELKDIVSKLNLNDKINIFGLHPNIATKLSEYDILINTSLNEGTPNVLLEAINAEIVLLARKNSASEELLISVFDLNECLFNNCDEAVNLCLDYLGNKFSYLFKIQKNKFLLNELYSTNAQYVNLMNILNSFLLKSN